MKKLFLFLLVLFFLSCSDNSTGPDNDLFANNYFPFNGEYMWIRETENLLTTTIAIDTIFSGKEYTLEGGIKGPGYEWGHYPKETFDACIICLNGELRWYTDLSRTLDTINYSVLLKEPIETGNKWPYDHDQYGFGNDSVVVIATGLTVEVPAGTYDDCIKIDIRDKHDLEFDYYYLYFAPDIGIIKEELNIAQREGVLPVKMVRELLEFKER